MITGMPTDRLDPTFVRAQIEHLRVSHPDIWDDGDEQLLLDMLEAETGLHEFLGAALDGIRSAEALCEAIEHRVDTIRQRRTRYERRVEALRALCFKLMTAADVRKLELPEATLSIRAGTPRVIITDEAALPPDCIRIRREPDKIAIKERLARGDAVPGAEMSNAEPVLSLRTK